MTPCSESSLICAIFSDFAVVGERQKVNGLTIGIPTNYFFDCIDPEVESSHRLATDVLAEAGANVREVEFLYPKQYMAIEFGLPVPESSQDHQETLRRAADRYEEDVRVLLEAGEIEYEWPDGIVEPTINAYVRASAPGNVTGLPAMSVPCGFSSAGLPNGMQIIGRPFDEETVFHIGHAYESRTQFTKHTATFLAPN